MKAILEGISDEWPITVEYIKECYVLEESDCYIKQLLQNAFEYLELETGLSLRKKTWKLKHNNYYFCLMFGPIVKIFSILDASGKILLPLETKRSHDNLTFKFDESVDYVEIRYEAGYSKENLPECLKMRVIQKFWDLYSEYEDQDDDCYVQQKEVMNEKYYFKY